MTGIPFAYDKWSEIIPGLFQVGHDWNNLADPWDSDVVLADEFDVVYSFFHRNGHGPAPEVEHHFARIPDGFLTKADLAAVRDFADRATVALQAGRRVGCRCQAGLNRSGLLVAFVLLRLGWAPEKAIAEIQSKRSPWALHNEHFVSLIFAEAVRLAREDAPAGDLPSPV